MDKSNPLIYLIGSVICIFISLNSKQTNVGAIAASTGGIILAKTAMKEASERFMDDEIHVIMHNAEISKYELLAQSELMQLLPSETPDEIIDVQATEALPSTSKKSKYYDLSKLPKVGNGVLVGAGPGYGKTSMVAGYFVPLYTQQRPAEIIVLDPDTNVNRWDKWGYERTINDYDEILECLEWFVSEKERRKKLKDYELEKEHDLILIWDEINDCRQYWNKKEQDEAARCLGILLNSRKYKITVFAMMQDANVEAIGISKKKKDQAVIVLSGKGARDEAQMNGVKFDDSRMIEIENTGYPCVVSGAVSFQLAVHPTHGHHLEYERYGKAPANIMQPIFSDKQIIPFARVPVGKKNEKSDDSDTIGNNIIHTETGKYNLNKEDETEPYIDSSEKLPDDLPDDLPEINITDAVYDAIKAVPGFMQLPDINIEAALIAIRKGEKKSHVIKKVLKMEGRKYQLGQSIYSILREFV